MSEMVLGDVASWHRLYLAAKPSHVEDRCRWASLPSAPSYDLQSSDKGIELLVRCYLVPSCSSGRWLLFRG
jgi:hypothetical protein